MTKFIKHLFLAGLVVAAALAAWAVTYSSANYMEPGGSSWVVTGSLNVGSGGVMKLAGSTLTTTELGYVNDVTPGTLTASKALIANSSSQMDIIDVTSSLKYSGVVQYAIQDTYISSAAVKTLNATPVAIVSEVAGYNILPIEFMIYMDYGAAAYDGIGAEEDLEIRYNSATGTLVALFETTGWLDSTSDEVRWHLPFSSGAVEPIPSATLKVRMRTGEVATGDAPLKIRTIYRLVPNSW